MKIEVGRGTGRTTRMLAEAFKLAREGRAVYVFGANEVQRRLLEEMAGPEADALGIKFKNASEVEILADPNCAVLMDHFAIESRLECMHKMLQRWDRPACDAPEKGSQSVVGATLDIRFDGPPGPTAGRFIECEIGGRSVGVGEWVQDGDTWLLRIPWDRPADQESSRGAAASNPCGMSAGGEGDPQGSEIESKFGIQFNDGSFLHLVLTVRELAALVAGVGRDAACCVTNEFIGVLPSDPEFYLTWYLFDDISMIEPAPGGVVKPDHLTVGRWIPIGYLKGEG